MRYYVQQRNMNGGIDMKKGQQAQKLNVVIHAIEAAGYNPYAQLTGYMATGNAAYITRQGGARTIVRDLD